MLASPIAKPFSQLNPFLNATGLPKRNQTNTVQQNKVLQLPIQMLLAKSVLFETSPPPPLEFNQYIQKCKIPDDIFFVLLGAELCYICIIKNNNTHGKLLDSDCLRAVQFKCNTTKSVTRVQKLDYDLSKDNEKFWKPMISCKAMTKVLYGNL